MSSNGTTAAWRNRIVGHGAEAPDQLLANPRNWRVHPKDQQRALAGALDEVGWVQQVLVNRTTGHLVDGHLRVELAITRGEPSVPVTYLDLTEEEELLVLATLDPLAAMANAEKDVLATLLAELTTGDEALRAMLDDLARESHIDLTREGLTEPDEAPAVPEPAEVYQLNETDFYEHCVCIISRP